MFVNSDNGNGGGAGQTVKPNLSLKVLNQFSQTIPPGVAVRVGDLVQLVMTLDTTGPFYDTQIITVIIIYYYYYSIIMFKRVFV